MSTSVTGLGVSISAPSAPTVAQVNNTGALNGNYQYVITFVSPFGETAAGTASGSTTIVGGALVSNIAIGGQDVMKRKIYRTVAGGSTFLLVTTIADNITTSYIDNLADGGLGVQVQAFSTADSVSNMFGYFTWNQPQSLSVASSIVATTSSPPIISAYNNIITTCPIGGEVQLMPLSARLLGTILIVRNNGSNPLLILPASGNTINSAANLALGPAAFVALQSTSSTNWQQVMP
jgi:hypothetical protein